MPGASAEVVLSRVAVGLSGALATHGWQYVRSRAAQDLGGAADGFLAGMDRHREVISSLPYGERVSAADELAPSIRAELELLDQEHGEAIAPGLRSLSAFLQSREPATGGTGRVAPRGYSADDGRRLPRVERDVNQGISAEIRADGKSVAAACRRAAETLGSHARVGVGAAGVRVEILPGMVQALSRVSPVVFISMQAVADGRLRVETRVEGWVTSQSTMFGIIPVGPKTLVGRGHYLRFLSALETELGALDPGAGAVRRRGPGFDAGRGPL